MAQGTIKKLTDKGFGFISRDSGPDLFFHMSAVDGTTYDQLYEGQNVEYEEGQGPKGPRAETVKPIPVPLILTRVSSTVFTATFRQQRCACARL